MLLSKLKMTLAVLLLIGAFGAVVQFLQASGPQSKQTQTVENSVEKKPALAESKDDPLQLQIAKILKGHGGEKLEKLKTFSWMVKTESTISPETRTQQTFVQFPDKVRDEISHVGREAGKLIFVKNKDKRWRKTNDDETVPNEQQVPEERLRYFGPRSLLRLKDPEMVVSLLGERMVGDTSLLGDRSAICIKISRKDRTPMITFDSSNESDEIQLYFDKDSGLLLKEEFISHTELSIEVFYSSYKEINGIPVAHKRIQRWNGEVNNRSEIEFKIEEKIDPKLFEKP
jgi:hypothetical protein